MAEAGPGGTAPTTGDGALPGTPSWDSVLHDSTFMFAGVCDLDGRLLAANTLAAGGRGFDRAEALDRPLWDTGWWDGSTEGQPASPARLLGVPHGGGPVRAG